MKKLFILCVFLLAGCATQTPSKTPSACSEEQACTIGDQNTVETMQPLSFEEALSFFKEKKSGLLYFGFENCPWCQEALPILREEAKRQNVSIHSILTRDENNELLYTEEQKQEIIPYLQDYMSKNEEGELTLYVPLVVVVKDGKAIEGHVGTVDDHDAHARKMTEEEKQELQKKYEDLLAQLSS
ncbi:TlpA family protein disulfide reductase [Dubosiella newyorkensis]|uniref:TlpA family protein disulfide reductase n=1 Tax=Dubosiella newyorkensis TaxID=1862672 RepID=UPI00272F2027|nr:thioredoxin family protein [Dubosiella newyorkensis]